LPVSEGAAVMLTIELPFPSSSLMPNRAAGQHWASLHAAKRTARDTAYALTKQAAKALKPMAGDVPLTLTFHAPDRRKRDRDNCLAAAKHQLDGVALALGIDDSQFEPLTVCRGEPVPGGRMVVTIGATT